MSAIVNVFKKFFDCRQVPQAPGRPVELHAQVGISDELVNWFAGQEERLQGETYGRLERGLFDVAHREGVDIFHDSIRFIEPYFVPAVDQWIVKAVAWGYPRV